MTTPLWIFGYGSLVWRPAFAFAQRHPGYIEGWARRFWQHSTDHRGVVGAPGRVVTLTPDPGACCWGMAYRVRGADHDAILAELDHREKNGYARHREQVIFPDPKHPSVTALVYVASEDNDDFAGPASLAAIAAQIRRSRGPSGENTQYVLELAAALRSMDAEDPHVFALASLLEH